MIISLSSENSPLGAAKGGKQGESSIRFLDLGANYSENTVFSCHHITTYLETVHLCNKWY